MDIRTRPERALYGFSVPIKGKVEVLCDIYRCFWTTCVSLVPPLLSIYPKNTVEGGIGKTTLSIHRYERSEMMRILFLTLLLLLCARGSLSAVPPSPAGGDSLGIHQRGDHVFLPDHEDFDVNLQETGFTLEMWIYLERPLEERMDARAQPLEIWTLLQKAGSYRWEMFPASSPGFSFFHNGVRERIGFGLQEGLPLYEWHYIAVTLSKDYRQAILNDRLRGVRSNRLRFDDTDAPLQIGGGREPLLGATPGPFLDKPIHVNFTGGRIDEVRISNIVRYPEEDVAEKAWNEVWEKNIEIPIGAFQPDEHTRALWHFDVQVPINTKWRDASINRHDLTYTGNALESRPLNVHSDRKLATTWAEIKGR